VPEVAAARANYESAQAQARLAAADAKRYENLVASGDVSRSAFDKAHTQQETADAQANAARQQYEAALNGARQGFGAVESAQAGLAAARAQLAHWPKKAWPTPPFARRSTATSRRARWPPASTSGSTTRSPPSSAWAV
jgi:hypothetical protein